MSQDGSSTSMGLNAMEHNRIISFHQILLHYLCHTKEMPLVKHFLYFKNFKWGTNICQFQYMYGMEPPQIWRSWLQAEKHGPPVDCAATKRSEGCSDQDQGLFSGRTLAMEFPSSGTEICSLLEELSAEPFLFLRAFNSSFGLVVSWWFELTYCNFRVFIFNCFKIF